MHAAHRFSVSDGIAAGCCLQNKASGDGGAGSDLVVRPPELPSWRTNGWPSSSTAAALPALRLWCARRRCAPARRSGTPSARRRSVLPTGSVSWRLPNAGPLHPNREHNAGFLTFEAVVTYPFHPLAGRTVLVIGQHEHDG